MELDQFRGKHSEKARKAILARGCSVIPDVVDYAAARPYIEQSWYASLLIDFPSPCSKVLLRTLDAADPKHLYVCLHAISLAATLRRVAAGEWIKEKNRKTRAALRSTLVRVSWCDDSTLPAKVKPLLKSSDQEVSSEARAVLDDLGMNERLQSGHTWPSKGKDS